ncbi:MAG: sialidase family protein, partial [Candidatus Hydrogenedentota bacterium]
MKTKRTFIHTLAVIATMSFVSIAIAQDDSSKPSVMKIKDLIIYQDDQFYAAFPSVVRRESGELIVAFRRAPDRRVFGEGGSSHTDPNSYLVLVRSTDNGESWTSAPELILAHPFGGSQDPCMIQLNDQTILCSSYGWARVENSVKSKFPDTIQHGNFKFMGGYLVRSEDGGKTWSELIVPPPVSPSVTKNVFGKPAPAYNRGAMVQDKKGRLYWAVAAQTRIEPRLTSTYLMTSDDGGLSWEYRCPIANDSEASFNETSLYITPKGDIVAFMRTADFGDHTVVARSTDGGKSFEPWIDSGFQGHPHFALRLPDDNVFLVYGYRHAPFGIRARILNSECTDFATADEIVLRDDGTKSDLGYPWATMTADGKILVTYYFHDDTENRHIAGTLLSIDSE